ncbi:hypothetical protein ACQKWADRAFT_302819 [Trichoderma austrokoningii]
MMRGFSIQLPPLLLITVCVPFADVKPANRKLTTHAETRCFCSNASLIGLYGHVASQSCMTLLMMMLMIMTMMQAVGVFAVNGLRWHSTWQAAELCASYFLIPLCYNDGGCGRGREALQTFG